MSTISSYDEALDFYPEAKRAAATTSRSFTATLRIVWESIAEGHAAASRYQQLVARGKSADEAQRYGWVPRRGGRGWLAGVRRVPRRTLIEMRGGGSCGARRPLLSPCR